MGLDVWTVYDNPTDYPNQYVARLFHGDTPTNQVIVSNNIETLRRMLQQAGLVHLSRMEGDDPVIMETWL